MIVPDLREEKRLWRKGYRRLAGVDEVGRGALAGPVVAATVSATETTLRKFQKKTKKLKFKVRDSKRLLPHQREEVAKLLFSQPGFEIKISYAQPRTIDRLNILRASLLASRRAAERLNPVPRAILVDGTDEIPIRRIGMKFVDWDRVRQLTYIKGDTKIFLIALASIVAKVTRDKMMARLAKTYPNYGFEIHKGYGTRMHRRCIKKFGCSPIHRLTFL